MKAKDMHNKSVKELQKDLMELQAELGKVAIEYRTKEIKNIKQMHAIKKNIARVNKVLHEKSRAEVKEEPKQESKEAAK